MKTKTIETNQPAVVRRGAKRAGAAAKPKPNDFSVVSIRGIRTTFRHAISAFNYQKAVGGRLEVWKAGLWQAV